MKLPKLNSNGFAHHFLLAVVVVGVAIGGTYYLVASKADSCDVSSATSGVSEQADVSGVSDANNCIGTSDPVSDPVDPPTSVISASCTITGVSTTHPSLGAVIYPVGVITNTGTQAIKKGSFTWSQGSGDDQGVGKGASDTAKLPDLDPGQSYSYKFTKWTVEAASQYQTHAGVGIESKDPAFKCASDWRLPAQNYTYTASCTITGVPSTINTGTSFSPKLTIKNTGTGILTTKAYLYRAAIPNLEIPAKAFTGSSLAPKAEQTIALGTYTVPKTIYATYSLDLNVDAQNGSAQLCRGIAKSKVVVAPISTITLNPSNWSNGYRARVANDSGKGSVLKLESAKNSPAHAQLTNIPVFRQFAAANDKKTISLCVTARGTTGSDKLQLQVYRNGNNAVKTYTYSKHYRTDCFNYSSSNSSVIYANAYVNDTVYIDKIVLKVK